MEPFIRGITLIGLFSVLGFGLYWVREYKKKTAALEEIIHGLTDCSKEMKETLAAGLVYRFGTAPSSEQPLKFGGFVATTSDFTNEARKYARETNVDLIDGSSLVELWAYSLAKKRELQRAKEA